MQFALQTPAFVTRLFSSAPAPRVIRRYPGRVPGGSMRELVFDGGRVTLHCREGEAWVTQDGDPKDVFLQATQSYTLAPGKRATLFALRGECQLEVVIED